jgi:glycosyltransferase involved in cell wall biosynthesis
MAEYLGVEGDRVQVIPPGLNLDGHGVERDREATERADVSQREQVTIGYFGRICPEKGLHLLTEAFELLCDDRGLPPLRLRAGGYLGQGDQPYFAEIEARLAERGLADRFEYVGQPDRAGKIAFLQSLDVMSLPTVYRESKGLSALEAWANGVPVVLPAHGAFPELVEDTGGGLLCEPHNARALADGLKQLIEDPAQSAEHGRRAQRAVCERYHAGLMAERMVELYGRVTGRPNPR